MFRCFDTEVLFNGKCVAHSANIERAALHKLEQLDLALTIEDMRIRREIGWKP